MLRGLLIAATAALLTSGATAMASHVLQHDPLSMGRMERGQIYALCGQKIGKGADVHIEAGPCPNEGAVGR